MTSSIQSGGGVCRIEIEEERTREGGAQSPYRLWMVGSLIGMTQCILLSRSTTAAAGYWPLASPRPTSDCLQLYAATVRIKLYMDHFAGRRRMRAADRILDWGAALRMMAKGRMRIRNSVIRTVGAYELINWFFVLERSFGQHTRPHLHRDIPSLCLWGEAGSRTKRSCVGWKVNERICWYIKRECSDVEELFGKIKYSPVNRSLKCNFVFFLFPTEFEISEM